MSNSSTQNFRYNICASIIGNGLEWFDFALFGYMAPLFAQLFLQNDASSDSLYSLFFLYFVGLLARPIGGILFSFFGDTLGRRFVLLMSIAFMSCGAVITALLPTKEFGGIFASILLLFAISMHNLSAGGEAPAVVSYLIESAPKAKRTFASSWIYFGMFFGIFVGTVDFSSLYWELGPDQFAKWGWRLPFVLSGLFGLCGFLLRKKLHESPIFERKKHAQQIEKNPLVVAIKNHKFHILRGFGISILDPVLIHSLIIFTPTYLQFFLKKSATQALTLNIYTLFICLIITPFTGLVAEKIGRIFFLKISSTLLLISVYPLYTLIATGHMPYIYFAQTCLCALTCCVVGVLPSAVSLLFPAPVRCTGYALSHNLPVAIFGGSAPLLLSKGIASTKLLVFPSFYIIFGTLITLLSLLGLKQEE